MKLLTWASAVLASTAAFTLPQPTLRFAVAPDDWSPAPTSKPWFLGHRREALRDNTCGYVSGSSASPVSCPAATAICATNTYFGVHGCCDPASLSACTIPTTCIPSSAMRTLCSDAACSADNAIAKCTASGALECYRWLFQYDNTVMTQHGCAASAFTSTAVRSYGALSTGGSGMLSTFSPLTSPTPSPSIPPHTSSPKTTTTTTTQPLAPIISGTIGGCTILSLVALAAFLIHRHRRRTSPSAPPHPHSTPEYSSNSFPPALHWGSSDAKTWQSTGGGGGGGESGWPPAMAEMHGHDRAVEVEAREKTQNGRWLDTGRGPVEVEARTIRAVGAMTEAEMKKGEAEKSRWWRASPSASSTSPPSQPVVVEAPT